MLLLAGCDSIADAYAKVCNSAISGLGTDCKALIRLMVTCSHETMDATREAYSRLYGQDLVEAGAGLYTFTTTRIRAQLKAGLGVKIRCFSLVVHALKQTS